MPCGAGAGDTTSDYTERRKHIGWLCAFAFCEMRMALVVCLLTFLWYSFFRKYWKEQLTKEMAEKEAAAAAGITTPAVEAAGTASVQAGGLRTGSISSPGTGSFYSRPEPKTPKYQGGSPAQGFASQRAVSLLGTRSFSHGELTSSYARLTGSRRKEREPSVAGPSISPVQPAHVKSNSRESLRLSRDRLSNSLLGPSQPPTPSSAQNQSASGLLTQLHAPAGPSSGPPASSSFFSVSIASTGPGPSSSASLGQLSALNRTATAPPLSVPHSRSEESFVITVQRDAAPPVARKERSAVGPST